jgi:hypothetical protein
MDSMDALFGLRREPPVAQVPDAGNYRPCTRSAPPPDVQTAVRDPFGEILHGKLFVEEQWDRGKKTGSWVYHSEDGRQSARFTWEDDREVAHEVWSAPEKRWVPFDAR